MSQSSRTDRLLLHMTPRIPSSLALIIGSMLHATACTDSHFNALESPPSIHVLHEDSLALEVGRTIDIRFRATGGEGFHEWIVSSGEIPPGVDFITSREPEAHLTGTPKEAGIYRFRIDVEDTYRNVGGMTITATVSLPTHNPLEIVTQSIKPGSVGHAYFDTIEARGGTQQGYVWSLVNGQLPDGLTLTSTGTFALIFGTPTRTSSSSFTVRVEDSGNNTSERWFVLPVLAVPLQVVTSELPDVCPTATSTTPYLVSLQADGGMPEYTWTIVDGQLPSGMSLELDGRLHGQPSEIGFHTFVVQVEDSQGETAERAFDLYVTCKPTPPALIITTQSLPLGNVGRAYNFQLSAQGGVAPLTWQTSDFLPTGLTFEESGLLTGVPVQTSSTTLTVEVYDASFRHASRRLSLFIVGELPDPE